MTHDEIDAALKAIADKQAADSLARVPHVRTQQARRVEYRIRGLQRGPTTASTLCGDPVTDRDILREDVAGFSPPPGGKPLCPKCRALASGRR